MIARILAIAVALLIPASVSAETLIAAVSPSIVRIDQDFRGAEITVFGSIERDRATISRAEPYQLAIVVRGPTETVVARRKERVFGIWVNGENRTFIGVPSFYAALATTGTLAALGTPEALAKYEIGLDNIAFADQLSHRFLGRDGDPFRASVVRLNRDSGRYFEIPKGIEFLSDTLFRAVVPLGPKAPVGAYTVSVVLFQGDLPLAQASSAIAVTKTGFEQWMYDAAFRTPVLYGMATVIVALFSGWLAGVLFRRD